MYKSHFEDGGEIGDYYRLESDAFNFDPNDVDLSKLITDDFGYADSSALGALRYMPVDQQQNLLEQFYKTDEGKLLTPEQRIALENEIYGQSDAETKRLERQAGNEGDGSLKATGVPVGGSEKTSILDKLKKGIADITGLDKDTIGELGKYGLLAGVAKMAYDDAQRAREEARGYSAPGGVAKQMVRGPSGGVSYRKVGKAAGGGIGSLDMTTKQPFYLGGPTDGMADKIPAYIDNKRPAALSDGEFVIPADVVSHLGNGNSNAGAKRLYEMMDDIREARTGNKNQGIQINPNKFMPR